MNERKEGEKENNINYKENNKENSKEITEGSVARRFELWERAVKKWEKVPNGHLLPYECAEENWIKHLEQLENKAAGKR